MSFLYSCQALWPFMDSVTRSKVAFVSSKGYVAQIEEQRSLHKCTSQAELSIQSLAASLDECSVLRDSDPASDLTQGEELKRQTTELFEFDAQQQPAADEASSATASQQAVQESVAAAAAAPTVTFLQVLKHYAIPYSEGKFRELLQTVWAA